MLHRSTVMQDDDLESFRNELQSDARLVDAIADRRSFDRPGCWRFGLFRSSVAD